MNIALFTLRAVWLAIAYRIRGGGFYRFGDLGSDGQPTGGTTQARIIWLLSWQGAFAWNVPSEHILWVLLTTVCMWVAIIIPHGRFADMGRSDNAAVFDFFGMMGVSFLRALLVFVPASLLWQFDPTVAIFIMTLVPPVGYYLCYYIPFGIDIPYLRKKLGVRYGIVASANGTEWAELINGLAWAISLNFI